MVTDFRGQVNRGDRLIAAYEAALVVARETTPETVLQSIVDLVREVVPARYAALGMTDELGQIGRFFTSGMTPEDQERIGFPPGRPPLRTPLDVPILLGERLLGNLYLLERWDGHPFNDDDVEAVQILATHAAAAIDRAQVYHRAEEQRDQLRIILDTLPSGVLIVAAPDGCIEMANEAAIGMIFGSSRPPGVLPVFGRDLRLLQADGTPLSREQRQAGRELLLLGEVVRNQQLLLESASGLQVPVLAHAAPLPNAAGIIERAVLVLQDVTRLREAEQLKDDFLSLVSHEFRTPLTTIHGGAHLLANENGTLDQQTRRELLCDIVDESTRLDRMLANMLTLTDVMAGRLAASTEPLLVEPLARAVATEVAERAPDHTFVVAIPPDLPPAEGDPALLAQVLRNLYENAVKYSPAGGEIRTTATTDGRAVTLQVVDEGIGIGTGEVDRVFERFYRTGAASTVRGTGLGLYLSRHLIEAQGGRLSVTSAGPGQGAAFGVTLPIARGWTATSDEELTMDRNTE